MKRASKDNVDEHQLVTQQLKNPNNAKPKTPRTNGETDQKKVNNNDNKKRET